MYQTNIPVILASASPRRQTLLTHLIDHFDIAPADIDETPKPNEDAKSLVMRLGKEKAQCVLDASASRDCVVIGSDTVVAIEDEILGKPKDFADFARMMQRLANATHQVYTSIAVISRERVLVDYIKTEVMFSSLTERDTQYYWDSGEPADKAGGYAIQGIGGQFVKSISGSFSAVVGLPLEETKKLIIEMGVIA